MAWEAGRLNARLTLFRVFGVFRGLRWLRLPSAPELCTPVPR